MANKQMVLTADPMAVVTADHSDTVVVAVAPVVVMTDTAVTETDLPQTFIGFWRFYALGEVGRARLAICDLHVHERQFFFRSRSSS